MVRQRKISIVWILAAAAAALAVGCMGVPLAQAQPAAGNTAEVGPIGPILTSQLPAGNNRGAAVRIQPRSMRLYRRAIQELHRGHATRAEKDAGRAVELDPGFADAEALAATASLAQRQFDRAREQAEHAAQIDREDAAAWVVLATADNYLARYADAVEALNAVPPPDRAAWQYSYQRARAEAGQQHAAEALAWANRAALAAPQSFAPLHLLRASALLAAMEYRQSGDELEQYLQLPGGNAPGRAGLIRELQRIREMEKSPSGPGTGAE